MIPSWLTRRGRRFGPLYHQGSVYSASFAAVPVLADIATGRKPGGRWQALGLAGRIVVEEQQLHEPGYVQARYPAAINELHQLTQNHVTARPFEGDEDDFLYWLEHLLAAAIFARVMCSRRYTSATIARWDGRSLQRRSPSRVTISMVTHSTSACGRSSAAGWMTNEAPEQRD